jgi:hypothetical protein
MWVRVQQLPFDTQLELNSVEVELDSEEFEEDKNIFYMNICSNISPLLQAGLTYNYRSLQLQVIFCSDSSWEDWKRGPILIPVPFTVKYRLYFFGWEYKDGNWPSFSYRVLTKRKKKSRCLLFGYTLQKMHTNIILLKIRN